MQLHINKTFKNRRCSKKKRSAITAEELNILYITVRVINLNQLILYTRKRCIQKHFKMRNLNSYISVCCKHSVIIITASITEVIRTAQNGF